MLAGIGDTFVDLDLAVFAGKSSWALTDVIVDQVDADFIVGARDTDAVVNVYFAKPPTESGFAIAVKVVAIDCGITTFTDAILTRCNLAGIVGLGASFTHESRGAIASKTFGGVFANTSIRARVVEAFVDNDLAPMALESSRTIASKIPDKIATVPTIETRSRCALIDVGFAVLSGPTSQARARVSAVEVLALSTVFAGVQLAFVDVVLAKSTGKSRWTIAHRVSVKSPARGTVLALVVFAGIGKIFANASAVARLALAIETTHFVDANTRV